MSTSGFNYYPLKPRITFRTRNGLDDIFVFDGFSLTNDIHVSYVDMEGAVGENGTFNIIVEDSQNLIDTDLLRNCKVTLELGKSQASYQFFGIGYADIFVTRRPRTNYKEIALTGLFSKFQANDLLLSIREASKIQDVDDPTTQGDPDFNINNIVKNMLGKRTWRLTKDRSIGNITGWSDDGVSDDVSINYPTINEPRTTFADLMNKLCATTGAVWFIDYSTGREVLTMTYTPSLHTGITIKSGDLKTADDDTTRTSYIKNSFTVEDNSTSDAGVATRLYTDTIISKTTISSSFSAPGWETLDFQAVAQQIIISNDQRRITDFAFVLSKTGSPDSPNDRVNGQLVLDNGSNKPSTQVVSTFSIPISSIDDNPQTVFVNDVDVKESLLSGQTKAWLVLFQRSGTNGQPQHDPFNTIRWHHDNTFATKTVYSGTAIEGDKDKAATFVWVTSLNRPTMTYSIFSDIRRLQARTNSSAVKLIGLKERILDSSYLSDPASTSRLISLTLASSSKSKRTIPDFVVTVPDDYLFRPYQEITFVDGLSGLSQELQVQRARYVVSALPGSPQIGTLECEISVGGLFNPLLANCSCTGTASAATEGDSEVVV